MADVARFAKGFAPCLVPRRLIDRSFPPVLSSRLEIWSDGELVPSNCGSELSWCCSWRINRPCPTSRLACKSISTPTRSATGVVAGPKARSRCRTNPDEGASPLFPPLDRALVKAIACELVCETQAPLSRQSLADVTARAQTALGKPMSRSTVWRTLQADAIKPWQYRYWIYPRDPQFAEKAAPLLDLYLGSWQGQPLGPQDHIISADEKTSIQARIRCHPGQAPARGLKRRLEFEYERGGALQYLAAWDVRRGYVRTCLAGKASE